MDIIFKTEPTEYCDSDSSESEWEYFITPKREKPDEDCKDLIKSIENFLSEVRKTHEVPVVREKKKTIESSYVKVRMERGDYDTAKNRLRGYATHYGRVQSLWVDHLHWANFGHIVFDHPLSAAKCRRDTSARYRPLK